MSRRLRNMKIIFLAVAVSGLLCVLLARADDNKIIVKRDRISLFKVPLKCPAAPEIGCGSAAKPILLALEHDSRIKEAWLDRTGTKLVVVGPEDSTRDARFEAVKSVLAADQTKPQELEGEEREAAVKQFESGQRLVSSRRSRSIERAAIGDHCGALNQSVAGKASAFG